MKNKLKRKPKKRDLPEGVLKIDWEKARKIFEPEKENLLKRLEREGERYPYAREILGILAGGVLVAACLVMPGLPLALKPFVWRGRGYQKKRLGQVLKRLHRRKLIEVSEVEGEPVVRITQRGITKALRFKLEEMKIKKPKSWDGKWRIVVFDIPERLKPYRDIFRERLKNLGFYRLQDSVFIHPYSCFDEVELLRQIYQVEIGVTYVLAERIEGQEHLKDIFKLRAVRGHNF